MGCSWRVWQSKDYKLGVFETSRRTRPAKIFSSAEDFPDFTFPPSCLKDLCSHNTLPAILYDSILLCIYCYSMGIF